MHSYLKIMFLLNVLYTIQVENKTLAEEVIQEEWIEPNAWGRKITIQRRGDSLLDLPQETMPKHDTTNQDGVALVYYKKLIATLFRRDNLQYNEELGRYYHAVLFDILPAQLDDLENESDPRELDRILQDLFKNIKTCSSDYTIQPSKAGLNFLQLIWDIFKDLTQLIQITEVRIALFTGLTLVLLWFCYRRYGASSVVLIILGVFLVYGYFITYIECNRKIENEATIEMINQNEDEEDVESWTAKFTNLIGWRKTKKQQLVENLRKAHTIKYTYCRPDHVLLLYANDIFLKQLEFLIEKSTSTIENVSDRLSWPFNWMAPFLLLSMIAYICKLTFEHILSPGAWISVLRSSSNDRYSNRAHQNATLPAIEDRISGDNLKTLLNFITNTTALAKSNETANAICQPSRSGVEEVFEQLEVRPMITPNNTPNSTESSSANNSPEQSRVEAIMNSPVTSNENKTNASLERFSIEECEITQNDL